MSKEELNIKIEAVEKELRSYTWRELEIQDLLSQIPTRTVSVRNITKNFSFNVKLELSANEIDVVLSGG